MSPRTPVFPVILLSALIGSAAAGSAAVVVIDNFDNDEGHFTSAPNFSGSNRRVAPHLTSPGAGIAPSTADQSFIEFFEGSASQKLVINRETDPSLPAPTFPSGPGEWFLRHVSATPPGTPGSPAANLPIPNTGSTWIGYWVKTSAANVEAGIMLDDDNVTTPSAANNHEMSVFQPLINDGLWHLYQWELANADSWEPFAGAQSNPGAINSANVTIDSLTFRGVAGVADSVEFYIDSVSYSTNGPIPVPEPSAAALAGLAALALGRRGRRAAR